LTAITVPGSLTVTGLNQRKKTFLPVTVGVLSLSSSEPKHFSVISGRGTSTDMLKRGTRGRKDGRERARLIGSGDTNLERT
jgi:hypothetical protein